MRLFWPIKKVIRRLAATQIENFLGPDERYFVRGYEVSRRMFEIVLWFGWVKGQRNMFKSNRARAMADGYPDAARFHGRRF